MSHHPRGASRFARKWARRCAGLFPAPIERHGLPSRAGGPRRRKKLVRRVCVWCISPLGHGRNGLSHRAKIFPENISFQISAQTPTEREP